MRAEWYPSVPAASTSPYSSTHTASHLITPLTDAVEQVLGG